MSLLSPFLELSISSRMYRHFSRFDSLGWHFTVKVPPQQIILAQCVFLWDQSCSLMIQVRYFSGLSIVNLIFLLYCASNDICFFAILCACDCTERFETWKVIFEFTYCIKKKDLAPLPLKFILFKSRGFKYACTCVYYALTMD